MTPAKNQFIILLKGCESKMSSSVATLLRGKTHSAKVKVSNNKDILT